MLSTLGFLGLVPSGHRREGSLRYWQREVVLGFDLPAYCGNGVLLASLGDFNETPADQDSEMAKPQQ